MSLIFVLVLIGLLGGLIAGLVGIGGGTLYVFVLPSLLASLHFPESHSAQFTIANSFTAIFFASTAAVVTLWKRKFFFPKPVFFIGISAILTSILTNWLLVLTPFYSKEKFNVVVIVLLFFSMLYTWMSAKKAGDRSFESIEWWKFCLTGFCSGFIAALSGLGGGIIIIPILNTILGVDIKRSSSVSSGAIVLSAFVIVVQNLLQSNAPKGDLWSVGYVVMPVSFLLGICVVIASPYGVKLSGKLPSKTISYIYALILLSVILHKGYELM
jgi:uncharacterized membrane protein YfcA